METKIVQCDLCHRAISGPGVQEPKYGAAIKLGHSIGGWGNHKELSEFSGEVCQKCYEEFMVIDTAVATWLKKREGTQAPTITITEHHVSCVQADEPPPDRRKGALLRILPRLAGRQSDH